MEEAIKYPQIIKEYFREYRDRNRFLQSLFYLMLFGSLFCSYRMTKAWNSWFYLGIILPMILALFAGTAHTSELPPMLYLVPGSKKMREVYIQRMLNVKVALPMAVCALADVLVLCMRPQLFKEVILQLITVFYTSYCLAIVNDGLFGQNTTKAAYGQLGFFNGAIKVVCVIVSCAMITICSDEISNLEFGIVFAVFIVIFAPLSYAIHKRWNGIREKLAIYELAVKEETW